MRGKHTESRFSKLIKLQVDQLDLLRHDTMSDVSERTLETVYTMLAKRLRAAEEYREQRKEQRSTKLSVVGGAPEHKEEDSL